MRIDLSFILCFWLIDSTHVPSKLGGRVVVGMVVVVVVVVVVVGGGRVVTKRTEHTGDNEGVKHLGLENNG